LKQMAQFAQCAQVTLDLKNVKHANKIGLLVRNKRI